MSHSDPPRVSLSDRLRNAIEACARGLGVMARPMMLPRKQCRYVSFPLQGVPRRRVEEAIRLRLHQLGLFSRCGFAWRMEQGEARVWCWDDAGGDRAHMPVPEPLWRPVLAQGLRLSRCQEGFELEGVAPHGAYRSRWFAALPGEAEQIGFARDVGLPDTPTLAAAALPLARQPDRRWRVCTTGRQPWPAVAWCAAVLVLVAGAIATMQLVHIELLGRSLAIQDAQRAALAQQSASTRALDTALARARPTVDAMHDLARGPHQLAWLGALASRGVLSAQGISLVEWAYRDGRVAMTLRIPPNGSASGVLAAVEESRLFADITLLPDPPQGTVRIQAALTAVVPPADSATPSPASEA
ncbi:MAG: hypothetical protein QM639_00130 [Rhodocyclaceae bacterium]